MHGLDVLAVDINWDESPVSFSVTMFSYCGKFSKVFWSRLGVKELTEKNVQPLAETLGENEAI